MNLEATTSSSPADEKLIKAEKAIRNGWIAGLVSGTLSILVFLYAYLTKTTTGPLAYYNDPWFLLDVAFIFVLAFGIYKRSRLASVVMVVYFIASKYDQVSNLKNFSGIGTAIAFLVFFAMAAWGTFVWHKLKPKQDVEVKKKRLWLRIILGIIGLGVAALFTFGLMLTYRVIPDNDTVVKGEDLHADELKTLRGANLISNDEKVVYLYSAASWSLLDEGNILTDKRVVSYQRTDGKMQQASAKFAEISKVEMLADPSNSDRNQILVHKKNGDEFEVVVYKDDGRDKAFFDAIQEHLKTGH